MTARLGAAADKVSQMLAQATTAVDPADAQEV